MPTEAKEKTKKTKEEAGNKIKIKLRSYDSRVIDKSCRQIVELSHRAGLKIAGPVPLPTEKKKYTVHRSTFVNEDSREQFEVRIHKRLIEVLNPNQRFIEFLRELTLPTGVEIEVKTL